MRTAESVAVKNLHLDLTNYRTMPQATEVDAIHAMIFC